MDNMELYNKFREVPSEAMKTIGAGRLKGMTDINPMWRIQILTETFGPCGFGWRYEVTNKWMETSGEEIATFVDIDLYVKYGGGWSYPIHGTGGSKFASQERNGIYVSDECYKMALTDAISVACKMLGIGADVYWASGRSKYNQQAVDASESKKNDQAVSWAKESDLISDVMAKAIRLAFQRNGIDEKKVLSLYNIGSLEESTIKKYKNMVNNIENLKTRCPLEGGRNE